MSKEISLPDLFAERYVTSAPTSRLGYFQVRGAAAQGTRGLWKPRGTRMRGSRRTALVALLALALGGLVGAPAPSIYAVGTVITVTSVADLVADDGICTLPEAVTSANSGTASGAAPGECAPGGPATLITFAPALSGQTVNLTTAHDSAAGPSGFGVTSDITIDGSAGGITIARSNAAPNMRLFYVAPTASLTLRRLTLQGGVARGASGVLRENQQQRTGQLRLHRGQGRYQVFVQLHLQGPAAADQ